MGYNSFYQIHKALRALLYETAAEIQHTDFNNEEEAAAVIQNIIEVVDFFERHAHHEDHLIFPAVAEYEPSVVDAFEQEHVKDHELSTALRTLTNVYGSLETDDEKILLGSAIRKSFVEFLTFNLVHMAKEEDIINNLLWRYYTDGQIHAMEQKIIEAQTPATNAIAWKWMLRGLSNREISAWLKKVETNAPEFVFNTLFALAEKELPGHRFRQVMEEMTEGQMMA